MIKTKAINELNKSISYSVKDNSPRGIKTIPFSDVKVGDEIVIDNHFVLVTEPKEINYDDKTNAQNINQENDKVKEFLRIFELYYNDIDNLCKRLQDDYNDEISFVADEQDRLALCGVLDAFDEINKENEINSSIEARAKMEDDYDKWIEEK